MSAKSFNPPRDLISPFNQSCQRVASQTNIAGDYIASDKVIGDKVIGNKIVINVDQARLPPAQPTPPPPLANFVGRTVELETISQSLTVDASTKSIVLYGMSGVGKTAIALEIANRGKANFPGGIFWGAFHDHAGNPRPLLHTWYRACTGELPTEIALPSLAEHMRNLFAARISTSGAILVVCDHVRRDWFDALQLIATLLTDGASLLVTMQEKELAYTCAGQAIGIAPFEAQEAIELLSIHIGQEAINKEQEATSQLLATIGYHPLATNIAGKRLKLQLQKPGSTIAKFCDNLLQNPFKELVLPGLPTLDSLLSSTFDSLPHYLQDVFCCIGVFLTSPVTVAGIAAIANLDHAAAEAALDKLVSAALIDWTKEPLKYAIHPLLSRYAQARLEMQSNVAMRRENHTKFCLDFVRENAKLDANCHQRLAYMLPDTLAVFDFLQARQCHEQIVELADLLYTQSLFLDVRSYSEEAELLLIAAVASCHILQDQLREGRHLSNLGNVYFDMGNLEQAFSHYKKAQQCAIAVGDRQLELDVLIGLGRGYQVVGDLNAALACFQNALLSANDLKARRSQAVLLGNLGNTYQALAQIDNAIECYHQSQAITQEIGDRRNEGVTFGNLASLYRQTNQIDKAIDYYKQALTIANAVGDNRQKGAWLGHLGDAYADLGQWQQAIAYYEQALSLARSSVDIRREGIWLGNLGTVYEEQENFEQALKCYHSALDIAQRIGDQSSAQVWLNNLSSIYCQIGEAKQAIAFSRQALDLVSKQEDEQAIVGQLISLGLVYQSAGQQDKGAIYLTKAQSILLKSKESYNNVLRIWLEGLDNSYT